MMLLKEMPGADLVGVIVTVGKEEVVQTERMVGKEVEASVHRDHQEEVLEEERESLSVEVEVIKRNDETNVGSNVLT